MSVSALLEENSAEYQLECARNIVAALLSATGLAAILRGEPAVIVGAGNWISFDAAQPLSSRSVLQLRDSHGRSAFVSDVFKRHRIARSRTNPSIHLTNLDSGQFLHGHVDAYYWATHPLTHAAEFFTRRTTELSDLLHRLRK